MKLILTTRGTGNHDEGKFHMDLNCLVGINIGGTQLILSDGNPPPRILEV